MIGFYRIYHAVISGNNFSDQDHNYKNNTNINSLNASELEDFKGFLRDLVMHGELLRLLLVECVLLLENLKIFLTLVKLDGILWSFSFKWPQLQCLFYLLDC